MSQTILTLLERVKKRAITILREERYLHKVTRGNKQVYCLDLGARWEDFWTVWKTEEGKTQLKEEGFFVKKEDRGYRIYLPYATAVKMAKERFKQTRLI